MIKGGGSGPASQAMVGTLSTLGWKTDSIYHQEHIEPAKPAREHATAHVHVHYIDGEIQTWPLYSKYISESIYGEKA